MAATSLLPIHGEKVPEERMRGSATSEKLAPPLTCLLPVLATTALWLRRVNWHLSPQTGKEASAAPPLTS